MILQNLSAGVYDTVLQQATSCDLIHEAPVVLLNVDSQALHVLLKQDLLLFGGKGFVVCPLLRVFTQFDPPVLHQTYTICS